MRLFVTLCSLLVLAQAKPQGYNYGSGVSGALTTTGGNRGYVSEPSNTHIVASYGPLGAFQSASVGSLLSNSGSNSGSSFGHGEGYGSGAAPAFAQSGGANYNGGRTSSGFAAASYGSSPSSGSASNTFSGFGPTPNIGFGNLAGYQAPSYQQQQEVEQHAAFQEPLVHKQFITVAAPEENENLERVKHLVIGRPQKNYRVVFIKAPSSSSANVKLSAEYAPKEEKTVIYVLSKKDSSLEVNDIATPAPTIPSKPEVFFIKYKTDAEASHAQQQIQAEYDRIEGSSEHTDGGVAPEQSVVGILDGGNSSGSSGFSHDHIGAGSHNFITTGSSGSSESSGNSGSTLVHGGSHGISSASSFTGSGNGGIGETTAHKSTQSSTYLPPSH